MATRNLDLALRLKADLEEGRRELQGLSGDIQAVERNVQTSSVAVGRFSSSMNSQAKVMHAAGMTVGQYQQAMRQLPMQITDVVTSVASGMPIWMVAIQQGGQLRDSFNGVGNAGRALLSILNPLTLAIGATVASAGALAIAYRQGSQEGFELNKSIILTGNAAGTSADQLMNMASEIDGISGTQGQAAAALAEVTRAGKFTAAQIREIATTAVVMENAVGKAVGDTVEEFKRLADEPAAASAKLNEQYNYLTASVYEQIKALEDQGDEAAAAQLAFEQLNSAMRERATEITGHLGLIEKAWQGIKTAAAEAWDEMLSVGREQTLEEQLAALDRKGLDNGAVAASGVMLGPLGAVKELWDQIFPQIQGATEEGAKQLEQDRHSLRLRIQQRDQEAAWQGEMARLNQESIEAQQAIAKVREQGLTKAEQKEKAIAEYRANVEKIRATDPNSALIASDKIEQDIARIEARYAERKKRTPTDRELKNQQQFVAQLERQAATIGMNAAEVRQYDLAEKNLTGTLHERAAAALVLIDQGERKRQADADGKQLATIQAQLLAAQGQQAAAAALQIEQQYGELIKRLQERGDQAGLDLINRLINVEQASAQLDELNAQVDRIFSEQSRRESSIQSQQQAGLLSEIGARQQILDLNKLTADQIEQLLPKMRELAAATGDPAALERLRDLEVRLQGLRTVANEFANALKSGFETGLQNALQGLATGTMDLQEAALSFVNSISSSLASLASQQLAEMASGALFDGAAGSAAATATATAITTATTTGATAMGTGITSAGSAAATAMATSITSAGTAAASAMATAIATAQAAGSTADTLGTVAQVAAVAAATGGHITGPGTGTSDSIQAWLSNNEFVTRAAVVTQQGALPFLHDFNARGMAALDEWAARRSVYHSTGGLAGVPAPALPAPTMPSSGRLAEPATSMGATLKNSQNFYLVDDPARIGNVMSGPIGQDAIVIAMSRDPAKFRSILNINGN
ncbi:phage tail length tape measure family protein [Pseudomonas paralcaligenes]|uniref:phage tail length tape measure family protein n=1 Tax=Pseudomonas paralcaligenes TaxID=2772558 RepID=UPI001C822630|nr:phage tail length tape measure family protein [Pseudomonas paralcaligenes]